MFDKIRKMKNKKGFTLVELIVVFVILAILAALLVPALTGYIDKANNQKIIAETRQTVMAAQTCISEAYGKNTQAGKLSEATSSSNAAGAGVLKVGSVDVKLSDIADLAEVEPKNIVSITIDESAKITLLEYTKGGKTCKYQPSASASNTDGDYSVS